MLPKGKKGLSRLSIFYKASRTNNIRNKFYSKAQCFRANFSNVSFTNVNFKGAILTSCNFKNASFLQVEFLGTNLKKSNFSGATFKDCVFSCVLMKKANFRNCSFVSCTFVATNVDTSKNLIINDTNNVLNYHPSPIVDDELSALFHEFKFNPKLQNSRVLYLRGGKLNGLTVKSLIDRLGTARLKQGLKSLNKNLPHRIITANSLHCVIDMAGR